MKLKNYLSKFADEKVRVFLKRSIFLVSLVHFTRKFYWHFGYIKYLFCRAFSIPYFGSYLSANQLWPKRAEAMRDLILKEPYGIVLEVGSWAGESTLLWSQYASKVYCIDHWRAAENSPIPMKKSTNKIFNLFEYNISGRKNIFSLKGSSNDFAPILKEGIFDLVYIDGDHGYNQFIQDLKNYGPLVKEEGIICGDDLEKNPSEANVDEISKNYHGEDTAQGIHPGILLGIVEFFGKDVFMQDGFWAMRKKGAEWILP